VNVSDGTLPTPDSSGVTGWAGTLRWTDVEDPVAVVFFHTGGDGGSFFGDRWSGVLDSLRDVGAQVVEVAWEAPEGLWGWTTRPDGEARTMRALSLRPAAVFDWVHRHLATSARPFALVGCSRGSDAVFAARYWHGLDAVVDYVMLSGGPPSADVYESCLARPVAERGGLCAGEIDTEGELAVCDEDTDCGGDLCDDWGFGTQGKGEQQRRMDHVHLGTACFDGVASDAFRASSYVHTSGDWDAPYPIDFLQTYRVPGGTGADDDFGVLVPGQEVYRRLTSEKRYRSVPGDGLVSHCATVFGPRAAETAAVIRSRLGL